MNNNQTLNAKEQSIGTISAFTAKGDLEQLREALSKGLDAWRGTKIVKGL